MTQTAAGTEVRWTAIHRAYPLLVGAGVFLVLVSMIVFPAPLVLGFLLFPAAVAALLGQLSLVGTRDTQGLRVRHALVSLTAVMAAMSPVIVPITMGGALDEALPLPRIYPTKWALFAADVAVLAGWIACHLERLVDRRSGFPPLGRARWNPRRWNLPGVVGVAVFLVAAMPYLLITSSRPLYWSTPQGMALWFAMIAAGVGAVVLLVCMCAEFILAVEFRR